MEKPIPAFYACYLLRSTIRHGSLYVGSTPNPMRRLRQHNGDAKGGAVRTSRDSLRPWEMTCLVTGFPSKIAALQFEWAWQNAHLTRHISPNSRLTQSRMTFRISPKTGRTRKRPARPRLSLTDRLANLHQLLRSSSFERWPLKVTFYAADVFRVWQKWATQGVESIRSDIDITLDDSAADTADAISAAGSKTLKGIQALDVTYSGMKPVLEKSRNLAVSSRCMICRKNVPTDGAMTVMCTGESCQGVGHLECMASSFTKSEHESVVPTSGQCAKCGTHLHWTDLVKELSLRMRGQSEIEKLFKTKRNAATKSKDPVMTAQDVDDELSPEDEEMEDEWHYLSDSTDGVPETYEIRSDPNPARKYSSRPRSGFMTMSESIIEDSDEDGVEAVT